MGMGEYREMAPPGWLADAVACFWAMQSPTAFIHRVPPDGCADIIYTRAAGGARLEAVGAMTTYDDFEMPPDLFITGVRFRPGMWTDQIGAPAESMTDEIVPLEHVWGSRARRLFERLQDAPTAEACSALLAAELRTPIARTPVQRAIGFMERRQGRASLDDVAQQAGLSARQFRRDCLKLTGLSPKLLARVLRFRAASSRSRAGG